MDGGGAYNNGGHRRRGAISGVEHGSVGVDCRTFGYGALRVRNFDFHVSSLQLL
ncbi:hypothetical protein Goari_001049 [Gossypium aridum]|uniref:Uncharacterized protein n=1 Tax=Gossypium aridum TaxID=34290 RepID=A0A7J8YII8_GOSAI|nr:hypothetical protein [Gossypium aridum]